MYLVMFVIGAVIGAFAYDGEVIAIISGGIIGIVSAVILGWFVRAIGSTPSRSGVSSAFDGCILFILLEGLLSGL